MHSIPVLQRPQRRRQRLRQFPPRGRCAMATAGFDAADPDLAQPGTGGDDILAIFGKRLQPIGIIGTAHDHFGAIKVQATL